MAQAAPSSIKAFAFRLKPHQDVKEAILDFAKQNEIKAGLILTAVGSVEQANLRYANKKEGTKLTGHFEVVSLSGTFSESACHLHMSISDGDGKTLGGHLLDENLVYTTLELVVGELPDVEFTREPDPTFGYNELTVRTRRN